MCATSRPFQKEILEHEQRSRVDPDAENLTGGKPSRIDTTPTPRVLPGVGEENGAWEGVYLRSGRTIAGEYTVFEVLVLISLRSSTRYPGHDLRRVAGIQLYDISAQRGPLRIACTSNTVGMLQYIPVTPSIPP